ncbi:hypothetical protein [Flavobacterium sp. I3-2]|uniref:hypothetical protein n=1 Tax=Flavobacterium sp. I3-2 TaxID=2748319 RepID=UPI0015B25087|nr:hypothetical protein [Flavobacterium sp. I3-2]
MKAKIHTNYTILLLTLATLLSSCEGFKILTVYNKTGQEITVQTKPELPVFKRTSLADTVDILSNAKEYKIPADSSFTLLATFGPLLFNAKIKENDLATDYVKIMTPKDTIIAKNRTEILNLTKDDKTKYKKKIDKSFAIDDNKNIEAIIIRQ